MTLNLANPSFQNHRFHLREPVNNLINIIEIDRGNQVEIGHGWTAEQQAKVIVQLERYGARDAAEAHGKLGKFSGLIYRDIGQISSSEIDMAHEAELQTREDRSVAAAVNGVRAFDKTARMRSKERPAARETKIEVIQDLAPGARPTGNEVQFDIEVTPEGRSDLRLPA